MREFGQRRIINAAPAIGQSCIQRVRHQRRLRIEVPEFIEPLRLDEKLDERTCDWIDIPLTSRLLSVKVVSNFKHEGIWGRNFVEFAELELVEAFPAAMRKPWNHILKSLTRQFMQRSSKVWKRGIPANFGLNINGESLREKAVAVRKENMCQLVRDGCRSGADASSSETLYDQDGPTTLGIEP